jgi:thioredoxin 1
MLTRYLIGIGIGICLGGLMGYFGKCTSGSCPLTANPFRGAIYGGVMGVLFASAFGGSTCKTPADSASTAEVQAMDAGHVAGEEAHDEAVLHIDTEADFERYVINADMPCLADFYSNSCGPCRQLAPTIEALAEAYRGKAVVCKVSLDAAPQLARTHGIRGIPAVLFFEEGKEVERLVGLRAQADYAMVLDRRIAQ